MIRKKRTPAEALECVRAALAEINRNPPPFYKVERQGGHSFVVAVPREPRQ